MAKSPKTPSKKTPRTKTAISTVQDSLVSPLAPKSFPKMGKVAGVELGTTATGSKYRARDDVLAVRLSAGSSVAGVFTKSATASAPVEWCRAALGGKTSPRARMLIVNAGNANAFTGKAGTAAVKAVAAMGARTQNCRQNEIFIASTGVIGEPLDPEVITAHLDDALNAASEDNWQAGARAIMTTDTFPKAVTRTADIGGTKVRVNGIVKGSGMIAPDMATMLGFVFTDAVLPSTILQTLLLFAVRDSFNAITVDSDTSTSDTVLLFATNQKTKHPKITRAGDPRLADFRDKLQEVMTELAHLVVRDGEGASKFINVQVEGAATAKSARTIAFAIANSPLVKTAIAGEDANWGRVVMAVGKAGEPADRDKLGIWFGPHRVAQNGMRDEDYSEATVSRYMKRKEIHLRVHVGKGKASAQVWTCDLTHGYISINADYRS